MSKTFPKLNISLRELSRPRIVREEIVEAKPVSNNKVMKYTGNHIESGYMEGNPLQTPLVTSGTGVRVCKK